MIEVDRSQEKQAGTRVRLLFDTQVTLVGDWNYADNLLTNGTIQANVNYTGTDQTYQPTWDQFFRW